MSKNNKLNNDELFFFFSQLSLLLDAGITIYESVYMLEQDLDSAQGKNMLKPLLNSLREGESFYVSLQSTEMFPDYVEEMVHLGEETGSLPVVVKSLSSYYEQQSSLNSSIKNAVIYPVIMFLLMMVILITLLVKILPIFNQVYAQLGSSLTGLAKDFLLVGHFIQKFDYILFSIIILLVCFLLFVLVTNKGRHWAMNYLYYNRRTKDFFLDIAYSRFAASFALICASGIDIYAGLNQTLKLTDNNLLIQKINKCIEYLHEGEYIHDAIKKSELFNPISQRMLQIGYKSGNAEEILNTISANYQDKSISRIQSILNSIEPTFVIIFSILIGIILLSVVMPLIGIISTIG